MISTFEFIILGLVTGAITGITGASGVLVIVPILTTILDLPLKMVLGTSLLVDVLASLSVTIAYWRNKHVDIKSTVWILLGALLGAQAGSFFVAGVSKIFIAFVLAISMGGFGITMWRKGTTDRQTKAVINLPENIISFLRKPLPMVIIGFLIGLATGVFGAGGGLIVFIILYSFLGMPIKTAVGTSTLVMLLTAASGVAGYVRYGELDLSIGLIIGIAAMLGGVASSFIANYIRDEILARLIGSFFIVLALIMFVLKVAIPFNQQFQLF